MFAPLLHEFTYQAMAHDLLPIKEDDKVVYTMFNEESGEQKEMEIGEKDKIWVENRHQHMSKTIEKLMADFKKFIADNPHFANQDAQNVNINQIKDMLAGLPQFQEMKEAYSLHLNMAQACMNVFAERELVNVALAEQSLATGVDEDFRKPKNLADQLVRLLDNPKIGKSERLRLIMLYVIHRDGLITEDIQLLLHHADLPLSDGEVITNLELLGVRPTKALKDPKPVHQPLFPRKPPPAVINEELTLSRYQPNMQIMLEELTKGTLDQEIFPYTKPPLDNSEELALQSSMSLRSAKPTWARNRNSTPDNMQRIIVFMAGGATFSESRACYEVSKTSGRDVVLATSHMLTPGLFLKQVGGLSVDRRRLDLPIDRPKPKAPAHLFERERPPPSQTPVGLPRQPGAGGALGLPGRPGVGGPRSPGTPAPIAKSEYPEYRPPPLPPTQQMAGMSLNSQPGPIPLNGNGDGGGKLAKKEKKDKKDKEKHKQEGEEKKKRGFFGSKK